MKKSFFPVFLLCFLLISCRFSGAEVEGLVYVGNLGALTAEEFQRISVPEIGYVVVQVGVAQSKGKEIERIKELEGKGKKIILQFWWGPGGRYNWSYHCLPAIAYDSDVQEDFFKGIDKTIDAIGPENIYGAHLLEELFYFGVDIDEAGDWRLNKYRIVDGEEDGNCYTNNPLTRPGSDCRWSPFAPNLRRFNDIFKEETNLDMRKAPIWSGEENAIFHKWCERTSARAEIAFFEHLKEKYPKVKRFTWSDPGYPGSSVTAHSDFGLLRENLDGVISNPYHTANINYHCYSAIRTLCPEVELVTLLYGGGATEDIKRRRMSTAYIAGAKGIGFFEGPTQDYKDPAIWEINTSLMAEFKKLPSFHKKKGPILLVSGNLERASRLFTGLKSFDVVPSGSAHLVNLKDYPLVITYNCGLDTVKIEGYLEEGGILFTWSLPSFLKDFPKESKCSGDIISYGKGIVYYASFKLMNGTKIYFIDTLRTFLINIGKEKIAKEGLADKGTGYQYMEVKDKNITAYFQFYLKEMKPTEFKVKGTDLLTGEKNPVFGPEKTAIVMEEK